MQFLCALSFYGTCKLSVQCAQRGGTSARHFLVNLRAKSACARPTGLICVGVTRYLSTADHESF